MPKEQDEAGQAELLRFARRFDGRGDAEPVDAGERADRLAARFGLDEERQDEIGGAEARLADEVAQDRGGAQPAQAGGGKGHAL